MNRVESLERRVDELTALLQQQLEQNNGILTKLATAEAERDKLLTRVNALLAKKRSHSALASTTSTPSRAHSEDDIVMRCSPGRSSGGGSGAARCLTLEASSSQ